MTRGWIVMTTKQKPKPREKLTKMQRKILDAMHDAGGIAAFTGEKARVNGFGVFKAKAGGVIIRAYGNPAYFLKARGLIFPLEREAPGQWFVITDVGERARMK
jgi:hypothetical protein